MRCLRYCQPIKRTASRPPQFRTQRRQQAQQPLEARDSLLALEGAWVYQENRTHLYGRMIGNELVMPYCYGGNDRLTSVFYGWKKIGEFWFARFCWLTAETSGYAFLKQESVDLLTGAWWAWWGDDGGRRYRKGGTFVRAYLLTGSARRMRRFRAGRCVSSRRSGKRGLLTAYPGAAPDPARMQVFRGLA